MKVSVTRYMIRLSNRRYATLIVWIGDRSVDPVERGYEVNISRVFRHAGARWWGWRPLLTEPCEFEASNGVFVRSRHLYVGYFAFSWWTAVKPKRLRSFRPALGLR